MPIFFGIHLMETPNGLMGVGDRDILQIDGQISRERLWNRRNDLTLKRTALGGLCIKRGWSDETHLVLQTSCRKDGFNRERLMVPVGQDVCCLKQEKRIERDNDFIDVSIMSGKLGDIFCITGDRKTRIYMICEEGVFCRSISRPHDLKYMADLCRERFGERAALCLEPEGFNYTMWRDCS